MQMSNRLYEGGFYNEEQKKRYLNVLPSEESAEVVARILSRAKPLEEQFGQDLYNFTLDQIEKFLYYLEPSTMNASRSNYYIVQNYIRWGIEQDLRDNNLNPLDLVGGTKYFKKFLDKNRKTLYRKDEIDKIVDGCVNAQDAVIIQLIFEGAFGTKDFDELLNLTKDSIISERGLLLKDGSSERVLNVSEKCINLVQKALQETRYYKKNGNPKETLKSKPDAELIQNDYVLRNVKTRTKHNEKADSFLIRRRLDTIREFFDLKIFTAYTIRNSGMLWMAKQLYDKYGQLGKNQYEEICERFNIKKVHSKGYQVYNYHRYKEDFLNVETIKEIYNEE